MYLEFYGLTEKPFSQTPDPRFLYWNDGYRETLAALTYGIRERKGFLTMIGEAGTGKTTLLRKLLDDLGSEVLSVLLFNPNATFEEILEYTLSELGIAVPSGRKLAMLQRLNEFLLAAFAEGRNVILLIDEAQDLDSDVLESLRLLSNLETSQEKILQIVLSGQPELAARLAEPGLRQLKQRIAVRCRLEPLRREELGEYIAARLVVAGSRPDLFAAETLDPIWRFAEGIPRLINMVCDNALLVGYALGRRTIDRGVIDEVVSDLRRLDVDFAAGAGAAAARSAPPPPAAAVHAPPAEAAAPTRTPADPASAAAAPPPGAAPVPPAVHRDPAPPPPTPEPQASAARPRFAERPAAPPRQTRQAASGLRWLGAAVAAVLLLGIGGLLALWAQGSLSAGAVHPSGERRASAERASRSDPAAEGDVAPDRARAALDAARAIPGSAAPSRSREDGGSAGDDEASRPESAGAGTASAPLADGAADGGETPPAASVPERGSALSAGSAGGPAEPVPAGDPIARPAEVARAEPDPATNSPPSTDEAAGAVRDGAGAAAEPRPATADEVAARDPAPDRAAAIAPETPPPALEPGVATAAAGAPASDRALGTTPPAAPGPGEPERSAAAAADRTVPERADRTEAEQLARAVAGRRVQVRLGDTLSNLATRAYGSSNFTTLDMLKQRNPEISDIDLILEGEHIEFPDPGPDARLLQGEAGVEVLVLTTPQLVEALAVQEALEQRYGRPVDLEPTELGRRRDLYRVTIPVGEGRRQALEIASSLGSILQDPGS